MFFQKYQFQGNLVDRIKGGIKSKFNKVISLTPKSSVLLRGCEIMTVMIIFSVMPLNMVKAADQTQITSLNSKIVPSYQTDIVLDKNDIKVLAYNEPQTPIEIGQSSFDLAQKSIPKTVVASKYPDAYAHTDPTEFRPIYKAAAERFDIPWQLIEAVHQVESGKSGSTDRRSSEGAVGPMQFMPATWRAYEIDGDGDGNADITNVTDAIFTASHYLAVSGADNGHISQALFNYNHSQSYVSNVESVAYEIGMSK
jgi:soluble lytic murein transglycosylase-like protein